MHEVFKKILQEAKIANDAAEAKIANDAAEANIAKVALAISNALKDNPELKTVSASEVMEGALIFVASALGSATAGGIAKGDVTIEEYDSMAEALIDTLALNLAKSRSIAILVAMLKGAFRAPKS
jgi:hypothetical protein